MKPTLAIMVDDEAIIARQVAEALSAADYDIIAAESAEQAPERIAESREAAALITGIRLPGMSGRALAREVRRRFPRRAAICMSGDSGAGWLSEGVPLSAMADKPFVAAQILGVVRSMLEKMTQLALSRYRMPDAQGASQA